MSYEVFRKPSPANDRPTYVHLLREIIQKQFQINITCYY